MDLILGAKSDQEYRAAVERFARETNDAYATEWAEAVEAVRALPANPTGLRKAPADSPLQVEVIVRAQAQVTDNAAQSDAQLAA